MDRRLVTVLAIRGVVVIGGIVVAVLNFADDNAVLGALFLVFAVVNVGMIVYFLRRQSLQREG